MKSDKQSSSNSPKARAEVENMKPYTAPLEGRRDMLRLDFNENTIGPSPLVIEAIKTFSANHISIYPEYNGLKEAVQTNLNSSLDKKSLLLNQIGLFNGVDAAIHAIFHAYGGKGDFFLTTSPTFGYYSPCAQMQGMKVISIPYIDDQFRFPLKQIMSSLIHQKPKILIICNPNNPTGTKLSPEKIIGLAHTAPNTLMVIDELYEAFGQDSVLPQVDFQLTPNLLILRSLSKTAGLAGLRIGFALGNEKIIDRINRVTGPYDINSFAVTAAFAALKDQAYIDSYVKEVLEARIWIKNQLMGTKIRHHIDGGNYMLIWPNRNSFEAECELRNHGILVRGMRNKPLIENSIRVSIGTKLQMEKFWKIYKMIEGI